MQTITLGRTNLTVTTAGLGCGGFSRIGIRQGEAHAAEIARAAYDAGVTFFDTAAAYGTETALGKGLAGLPRDAYVVSSKYPYRTQQGRITPEEFWKTLHASLAALGMEYIDVYHIHALSAADFPYARDVLVPEMLRAREQGKIRFLGVTEQFAVDTSHEMFKVALPADLFDVIMTGYNILNPSAARTVLPAAIQNNVAVLCMFAVRSALSNPAQLKVDLGRILAAGQGGAGLTEDGALDFLLESGAAASLPEAAYRFCAHTPGITVTLTGTGNREHLLENLRAINEPPLPDGALARLASLFGAVDCVSGQ
ncbi:MAG: aldo/keto reductase [Oscillospiraceae bacterium]|jgi:aryl-alcohol dehydrogenase-like predicted oxidoreductase|nr:aldo/keto reductase [Oscillospiraceae bacterium]